MKRKFLVLLLIAGYSKPANAQFVMDLVDTSQLSKTILPGANKINHLGISGYIQPQFQIAQSKGAQSYAGGDFGAHVNNRFMINSGRIRFDYLHFTENKRPSVQFVFQFEGTEKGVVIRDIWGRLFENKWQVFSFTTGLFARPFSYEINLSSIDRESPERGRMSQILMKSERDVGAMVSFEPRKKDHSLKYLKIDAGFFNGQGLTAPTDYDSHKDFITRVALKPYPVTNAIVFSMAASYLNGGFIQNTPYVYSMQNGSTGKGFVVDSGKNNIGGLAPRIYYGLDAQLKIKHKTGFTELRAEFITGKQTGTLISSETPPALLQGTDGYYKRKFNGVYFYLIQNIFNLKHQIAIKYDWYDPNTDVKGEEIGKAGSNLTAANIKYTTLGFGYLYTLNENVRLTLWYDKVTNEKTTLPGFITDARDNVFTMRVQYKF